MCAKAGSAVPLRQSENMCLKVLTWQCTAANTGNGGQLAVLDLHGQHVAEALKLLRREVTRLRGQNRQSAKAGNRTIQILVGTNHHSKVCSSYNLNL